jgi:hypothetical protein
MIWHYTYDQCFVLIREDGFIKPAAAFLGPGEKGITWFSKEQFWEPTVTKGLALKDGTVKDLDMLGLREHGHLLIRIGVDPETAPYTWSELKSLSGMQTEIATALASTAKRKGANPSRWRGTFEAVHADKWKSVEYFNGIDWAALPLTASGLLRPERSVSTTLRQVA